MFQSPNSSFKETVKELTDSEITAVVTVPISFYATHDSCTENNVIIPP